jgi:hypothetical protein
MNHSERQKRGARRGRITGYAWRRRLAEVRVSDNKRLHCKSNNKLVLHRRQSNGRPEKQPKCRAPTKATSTRLNPTLHISHGIPLHAQSTWASDARGHLSDVINLAKGKRPVEISISPRASTASNWLRLVGLTDGRTNISELIPEYLYAS